VAYLGLGLIPFVILFLIKFNSLRQIIRQSYGKKYSSMVWIVFLYFVYAAFTTGAFLTPEFVAISSLPIVSLNLLLGLVIQPSNSPAR